MVAGTATPLKAESGKPVIFLSPELASVDPNFRPHPDRNRVYYAGSLKQARGWAKYTSIPYNLCPNNCEYDFRKYGVFVIFYKGRTEKRRASRDYRATSAKRSATSPCWYGRNHSRAKSSPGIINTSPGSAAITVLLRSARRTTPVTPIGIHECSSTSR